MAVIRGKGYEFTPEDTMAISTLSCVHMNQPMQQLTGNKYKPSEQHSDMSKAIQIIQT